MKKTMFMFVFITIGMLAGNVFAQTEGYKEVTIKVPEDVTVEVLGEGEDQVIEIPFVVQRIHEVDVVPTNVTNVTHVEGNRFLVRSGVGVRTFQTSATGVLAKIIELDGEVGYSDSSWRVSGAFGAGPGGSETVAIGGNLVLTYLFQPKLRLGIGTDVVYFADVTDVKPKETSKMRFIGGAFRFGVAIDYMQLEAYLGMAVGSTPVVGGIANDFGGYGGLAASFLF